MNNTRQRALRAYEMSTAPSLPSHEWLNIALAITRICNCERGGISASAIP